MDRTLVANVQDSSLFFVSRLGWEEQLRIPPPWRRNRTSFPPPHPAQVEEREKPTSISTVLSSLHIARGKSSPRCLVKSHHRSPGRWLAVLAEVCRSVSCMNHHYSGSTQHLAFPSRCMLSSSLLHHRRTDLRGHAMPRRMSLVPPQLPAQTTTY